MTMQDMSCDICGEGKALGVFSTSVPFSCAMCERCIAHGADPEWVLVYLLNDVAGGNPDKLSHDVVTYKDGKYISIREYVKLKAL